MRNDLIFQKTTNEPTQKNEILKITSLIYFKEALEQQRYEECLELIQIAKQFGAIQEEINDVILEYTSEFIRLRLTPQGYPWKRAKV